MKTIIFDFDGTIADSEWVTMQIINNLASEFGYENITQSQASDLKKMSAKTFIRKRLKIPFWKLFRLERRAREEYNKYLDKVKIFPGITELMNELRQKGFRIGVLSSNSEQAIKGLLDKNNIQVNFIYSGSSIFGKANVLKKLIEEQGIDKSSVIYIGDEVRDVEASNKIGIETIAVTWGYNDKETLGRTGAKTADTHQELLRELTG